MISEIHAYSIDSSLQTGAKTTDTITPDNNGQPDLSEQYKDNSSTVVSLGNTSNSDTQLYSKQSVLKNAARKINDTAATEKPVTLTKEPEVAASVFGGTKKPPPQ